MIDWEEFIVISVVETIGTRNSEKIANYINKYLGSITTSEEVSQILATVDKE